MNLEQTIRAAYDHQQKREYVEAEELLEMATKLWPKSWMPFFDLACVKILLRKYDQVECNLESAEDLLEEVEPKDERMLAAVHSNRGWMYRKVGRIKDSIRSYEDAICKDPDFIDAHNNLGVALMLDGQRKEGLGKLEQRFTVNKEAAKVRDRILRPGIEEWCGESFEDKILLVYNEQGRGDAIQNVRHLPAVKRLGGTVILEVREELTNLLAGVSGMDMIIPKRKKVDYDLAVSINSLEHLLYPQMPNDPYIEVKEKYKSPIGNNNIKVGFAWAGSPKHPEDDLRSIPASLFRKLAIKGISLFSLQKDPELRPELYDHGFYHDFSKSISDFTDTARYIDYVDLVVTVDTAVAHLAGAMGKPVWLLLPPVPDCRWKMIGNTTDLYPSMIFVRQENDWEIAFDSMENVLKRWYENEGP
ncbi:MAG: tetratricopeptide repeat protein [Candidatus Thorarchaeota archaeon]|jgi:tetratricopeptide (TPR) repeat protein